MRERATGARRLTPPGAGAVAVLEIDGPDAAARLARVGLVDLPGPGEVRLVRPRSQGVVLDEALLLRIEPERFELHVHASPPLVEELCEHLGSAPEPAPVDVEEHARELVPGAASELGARVLLAQAGGALRREVERLRAAEPGEERRLVERAALLAPLLAPTRVVLVGAANAGKSTLFNALAGEARAMVSAEAGTTRDVLSVRVSFGPYPVDLLDTAGARELGLGGGLAADVEREGQALSRWLLDHADLVLHLVPAGEPLPIPELGARPRLTIRTKGDLVADRDAVSALRDPARAAARVAESALAALRLPPDPFPELDVGAPFTAALAAGLAAAFRLPPGPERDAALESCLGPAPAR